MTPTERTCGERRPVVDIDGLGYADCIEPAGHRGDHRFGRTIHDDGSEGLTFYRARLGDCWIDGCLRDAFARVTLKNQDDGSEASGLVCDEHLKEVQ